MTTTINFVAPAPYAQFTTRGGNYSADANGFIYGVLPGIAAADLSNAGCVAIAASIGANFRNLIDGGDFTVNPWQRNIPGLASGGVIAAAVTNTATYFADRFFAVGGASSSILMAQVADTTIAGFSQSLLVSRTAANTNTSAFNLGQVLETGDSVKCQGQTVTLSFWARNAANYSGGNLTVQLISGTGANQSAANMVATSWTGQANVINASQALSGSMTRYSFTGVVPATATQLGVLLAWTPVGTAGTVDGIYFNGFQLELGASASAFEHRDAQLELDICQRFAWVIPEPAAGVVVGMGGAVAAANNQIYYLAPPIQMFKAPTVTVSAGTFKLTAGAAAATATGIATNAAVNTPSSIALVTTVTQSAGGAASLQGGGGSGYIVASADF